MLVAKNTESDAGRIAWVDYGKGLAIALVFWGHTICPKPALIFFYAFHIPLFYALSGFVFSIRRYPSFGPFAWRKFRTLIVPGAFFGCIIKICQYVRALINGDTPISPLQTLIGVFVELRGGSYEFLPWFFLSLFIIEMVAYWLIRAGMSQTFMLVMASISALIGYMYGTYIDHTVPWCLDTVFTGLFFFVIGFIAQRHWRIIEEKVLFSQSTCVILCVVMFICSGVMSWCNVTFSGAWLDVYSNTFGWFVFYIPAAVFGIGAVMAGLVSLSRLSGWRALRGVLDYLGKNSLVFYAMNHVLIHAWTDLFDFLGIIDTNQTVVWYTQLWQGMLIAMLSALCCWPIVVIMNHYFPAVLGKQK